MESLKTVGIAATGSYVPEKRLTNFDLEKMVDTSDDWIRERTGIRQRHIAGEGELTGDLAGEMAAVDRNIGLLRAELRELGIHRNTMLWFNSDNGAIKQGSTGGLSRKDFRWTMISV